jgi:hypothetical protein
MCFGSVLLLLCSWVAVDEGTGAYSKSGERGAAITKKHAKTTKIKQEDLNVFFKGSRKEKQPQPLQPAAGTEI